MSAAVPAPAVVAVLLMDDAGVTARTQAWTRSVASEGDMSR